MDTGRGVEVAVASLHIEFPASAIPEAGYPKLLATLGSTAPCTAGLSCTDCTHAFLGAHPNRGANGRPYVDLFSETMAPNPGGNDGPTSNSPYVRLPDPVNGVYSARIEVVLTTNRAQRTATFTIATAANAGEPDDLGHRYHTTWTLEQFVDNNAPLWIVLGAPTGAAWRHDYPRTTAIDVTFRNASLFLRRGTPVPRYTNIELPQRLRDHCRGVTTAAREHRGNQRPNDHMQWVPRTQWMDGWNGEAQGEDAWDVSSTTGTTLVVMHHTASNVAYEGYDQCSDAVRGIYHHHTYTNGWGDIGYHAVVCGSWVFQGRKSPDSELCDWRTPENTPGACSFFATAHNEGAHAYGFNAWLHNDQRVSSYGVAILGHFDHRSPSAHEYWTATCVAAVMGWYTNIPARELFADVKASSGAGNSEAARASLRVRNGDVVGTAAGGYTMHNSVNNTECPGGSVSNGGSDSAFSRSWMDRIRWLRE